MLTCTGLLDVFSSLLFFCFLNPFFCACWGTEPYVALHKLNLLFPSWALCFLPSLPFHLDLPSLLFNISQQNSHWGAPFFRISKFTLWNPFKVRVVWHLCLDLFAQKQYLSEMCQPIMGLFLPDKRYSVFPFLTELWTQLSKALDSDICVRGSPIWILL